MNLILKQECLHIVPLQDALGQPFLVLLTQPGLRARTKAARNNLTAARDAAEKGATKCIELL